MKILESDCTHLAEISSYGYNYYQLPAPISDCNVVYEQVCDCYGTQEVSLGNVVEGKYTPKYYLEPSVNGDPLAHQFDFEGMSESDLWT